MENYEWELKTEAYLSGQMSAEDQLVFEEALEKNAALRDYVTLSRDLKSAVQDDFNFESGTSQKHLDTVKTWYEESETKAFAETFKNMEPTDMVKEVSTKTFTYWMPLIAASLIGIFLAIQWSFRTPDLEALYTEYSQWEDLPSFVVQSPSIEAKRAIEEAFKARDFEKTLALADAELAPKDVLDYNVLLYKGLALLELHRYKEAHTTFDTLINSTAIDAHKGLWYKAMIYLKQQDVEALKRQLELIVVNKSHYNYKKAQQLLEDLD